MIEGNRSSGVGGLLLLKLGGGLGEWGRGDLHAKRGRWEGRPRSGRFGLVRSWAGVDLLRWWLASVSVKVNTVYWLGVFPRFPKKDMSWSGGCIRVWSVAVTHVYSAKARIKGRRSALEI